MGSETLGPQLKGSKTSRREKPGTWKPYLNPEVWRAPEDQSISVTEVTVISTANHEDVVAPQCKAFLLGCAVPPTKALNLSEPLKSQRDMVLPCKRYREEPGYSQGTL